MPELHMDARPPHPVPQAAQETLSAIAGLPDIVIPPSRYNPLPLQCLAANALPNQVKDEIDRITSEYREMDSEQPTSLMQGKGEEEKSLLVLKRHLKNGYGLKVVGGVKCQDGELHAQVVCVMPDCVPEQLSPLKAGACIMSVNGNPLKGATFEQVKLTFNTIEKEVLDITYCICSKPLEAVPRHKNDCRSSPQRKKKPPSFLPLSQQTCSKKPRAKGTGRISVSSPVTENNGYRTGSVSPAPPPLQPQCETIILNHPNNMIQISLRYIQQQRMFFVSLHKFNGYCSSSWLDHKGVFVNSYLIPDNLSLGVRQAVMVSPTASTDELLGQSANYCLPVSELKRTSLRLVVWEAARGLLSKKPTLHGEVFLSLSDQEMISLHGVPHWYNVSPPDPNLPPVPKPYLPQKPSIDRVVNLMKSSWTSAQNAGTITLRKIVKGENTKRSISLQNMSNMSASCSTANLSSILDTLRDSTPSPDRTKCSTAPEQITASLFSFLYKEDNEEEEEEEEELSGNTSPETLRRDTSCEVTTANTQNSPLTIKTEEEEKEDKEKKEQERTSELNKSNLFALIASLNHHHKPGDCSVHPVSATVAASSADVTADSDIESLSSSDKSSKGESSIWASPVHIRQSASSWSNDGRATTDGHFRTDSLEQHDLRIPLPFNSPSMSLSRHRSRTAPGLSLSYQQQQDLDQGLLVNSLTSDSPSFSTPTHSLSRSNLSKSLTDVTDIDQREEEEEDEMESSLDFPHHRRLQLNLDDDCSTLEHSGVTTTLTQARVVTKQPEEEHMLLMSWGSSELNYLRNHSQNNPPTRWKSVDNLLNNHQPEKTSTRKRRWMDKIAFKRRSIESPANTGQKLATAYNKGKPVGSIKVQLTAKFAPNSVNVKVLNALFFKSSSSNTNIVVKASTFSNVTDTCEHKQKTLAKLLHNNELSPSSTFEFFVDPHRYSVQIVLVQGTQTFGRKSYSHAWIDLNKMLEAGGSHQTPWIQLRKLPLSL